MDLVKQYEECLNLWGPEIAKKKKTFDFTKIYISEVEKKIARLYNKNISMAMELDKFEYQLPIENCPKKLSQRLIAEGKIMKEELKEWIFITINPKEEIELDEFHNKIKSLTKWKCFQKGFYVLEQRGETHDNINGFHAHIMLVKYTIERKRLINRLETTFEKFCNKCKKNGYMNVINVKRKLPEHGRETLNEYMSGKKQEDKLQKVEIDKQWRLENKLDEIYFWDTTIDKSVPKKGPGDGRVNNGGKREGAGRPKKEEQIEWGKNVTIDMNKNIELSF